MAERVFSRIGSLIVGIVLLGVAIALLLGTRDTAVSAVIALAGCALVLYAMVWDRFQSFSPSSGLTLFERLKEDVATGVENQAISLDTIRNEAVTLAPEVREQSAQAASRIRQAATPEELAEVLVSIVERPETQAERSERIREDDQLRTRRDRSGPSAGSSG